MAGNRHPDEGEAAFGGTERFVVERRLGRGGMGVVFLALDRATGQRVALKTIRRPEPDRIYRFKREFRALADVVHPNLVTLYELVLEDDRWFFTMEYLEGEDFIRHVRGRWEQSDLPATFSPDATASAPAPGGARADPRTGAETATVDAIPGAAPDEPPERAAAPAAVPPLDVGRLRAALRQLTAGVLALHESGHLHRDIKPSNVVVTRDGRVVLMDFGVITEVAGARWQTESAGFLGTPAYMAPEVGTAAGVSPASDWYSVGVILYLALTGRRPFKGDTKTMQGLKRRVTPLAPSRFRPDCPLDLEALCLALLRATPAERPKGREILAQLGGDRAAGRRPSSRAAAAERSSVLEGREVELALLRQALATVRAGQSVIAHVHAESGLGKTALCRHFLESAERDDQALVLAGRCYERESLPYKALDALVDALARTLLGLEEAELAALLPPDTALLARLFPVLRSLPPLRDAPAPELAAAEARRRAVAAFRSLLVRLGQRRPLCLFIDDAQWGDADSARLLAALTRPPDAPPLLVILAYRTDEAGRSPLLAALGELQAKERTAPGVLDLDLAPLSDEAAGRLARTLLAGATESAAARIVRESKGHPLFLTELVRFIEREGAGAAPAAADGAAPHDLATMILRRVASLPPDARGLLEVVAVAGRPLTQGVAQAAAELEPSARATVLPILQTSQLVRVSGRREADLIEPYHDRIRETLAGTLAPEIRRRYHLRLAGAEEAAPQPDAEALATHYAAAEEPVPALRWTLTAAQQAERTLAFERAAQLYRQALELRPRVADGPEPRALQERLGDALANAGRGADAAQAYEVAAAAAQTEVQGLRLRRRAAEERLRAGYIDEGLAGLTGCLADFGLRLPRTPVRALASVLLRRGLVRWRCLRFRPLIHDRATPLELERLDLTYLAATCLAMVDNIRAADFQARYFLYARRGGDLARFARAVALEGIYAAMRGVPGTRRARLFFGRARALGDQLQDPFVQGFAIGLDGIGAFLRGDWRAGHTGVAAAEDIFRQHCPTAFFELATVRLYRVWSLYFLGELAEMGALMRRYVEEARDRGDLYAATNMRSTLSNVVWLVADDVAEARAQADDAIARWSQRDFLMQHYYDILARGNIDLYCGDGAAPAATLRQAWPRIRRTMILRIQYVRVTLWDLRARAALRLARDLDIADPRRAALLTAARRDARRLARERAPWASALADLLETQIAVARRDEAGAQRHFAAATAGFERTEMKLFLAALRWRHGARLGGAAGAALAAAGEGFMRGEGIVDLARLAGMLVPL
jgi:serine/threonine protein kinase